MLRKISEYPVCRPRLQPGTSRIERRLEWYRYAILLRLWGGHEKELQ
jgi:hypothetical protein